MSNIILTTISVDAIHCYAYHGCLDAEAEIGGEYIVKVKVHANVSDAVNNDDLASTVDYVKVYDLVKHEMAIRSKLIEHVAGRILTAMFDSYAFADEITVEVTKINPPVNGSIGSATVTVTGKGDENKI
jgi:7,8-dihydroneopterin aldolase/epimerase/oxygenase